MNKYTKERVEIIKQCSTMIHGISGRPIANCGSFADNQLLDFGTGENEANATRIAALWNGTLTIPTSALEAGVIREMVEALEEALTGKNISILHHATADKIRAVLDKLKE